MKAKVIAIGTSKGIRIPKYLLQKYGIEDLVEMEDTGEGIIIHPVRKTRAGWEEAFKKIAGTQQDALLDMPESEWDHQEWQW